MAIVHILKPAHPSFNSLEFETYNEANQWARKSAALNPSKPYKRVRAHGAPVWMVTVLNRAAIHSKPEYVRFPDIPGFTGLAAHLKLAA